MDHIDWESFIIFPEDNTNLLDHEFSSSVCFAIFDHEPSSVHFVTSDHESLSSTLFEQFNDSSNEINEINNPSTSSSLIYQYNLHVGDKFDDWPSVDIFMHNYCKE